MKKIAFFLVVIFAGFAQATPSLKDSTNTADVLLITAPELVTALSQYKVWRTSQGFDVKVVSIADIYREFRGYKSTVGSIKGFLDYMFVHWEKPAKYLLLVGDYELVPSHYMVSVMDRERIYFLDNYYVLTQVENQYELKIPVGRIPVINADELSAVLTKTINFEDQVYRDSYANDFLFVSDEGDNGLWTKYTDQLVDSLSAQQSWQRVDFDQNSPYLGTRKDLLHALNAGPLMVNYFGHTNAKLWSHDSVFTFRDVDSLENVYKPFVLTAFGCYSTFSVRSDEILLNKLILAENKGSVASISAAGVTFTSSSFHLFTSLYSGLLHSSEKRLGDILKTALNTQPMRTESSLETLFSYTLIGDPCLKIPIRTAAAAPANKQVIPLVFALKQNYPNPFNPRTTIEFALKHDANVNLSIFDVTGKQVQSIFSDDKLSAGIHRIQFDGSNLPSGVYLYKLSAGNNSAVKRMALIK